MYIDVHVFRQSKAKSGICVSSLVRLAEVRIKEVLMCGVQSIVMSIEMCIGVWVPKEVSKLGGTMVPLQILKVSVTLIYNLNVKSLVFYPTF